MILEVFSNLNDSMILRDPITCGDRAVSHRVSPRARTASSSGALSTGQIWSCGSGEGGSPSNDVRAGTPLLGGKAGRAGAAQPGAEKAAGRPQSSCQCLKEAHEKDGDRLFSSACCDGTRGDSFKLKEGRFSLDIGKKFSKMRVVKHWKEVVQRGGRCPIPGDVQSQVRRGSERPGLVEGVPAHGRGLDWVAFKGPFPPKLFYALVENRVFYVKAQLHNPPCHSRVPPTTQGRAGGVSPGDGGQRGSAAGKGRASGGVGIPRG